MRLFKMSTFGLEKSFSSSSRFELGLEEGYLGS
jgi:hypothetical protein